MSDLHIGLVVFVLVGSFWVWRTFFCDEPESMPEFMQNPEFRTTSAMLEDAVKRSRAHLAEYQKTGKLPSIDFSISSKSMIKQAELEDEALAKLAKKRLKKPRKLIKYEPAKKAAKKVTMRKQNGKLSKVPKK